MSRKPVSLVIEKGWWTRANALKFNRLEKYRHRTLFSPHSNNKITVVATNYKPPPTPPKEGGLPPLGGLRGAEKMR